MLLCLPGGAGSTGEAGWRGCSDSAQGLVMYVATINTPQCNTTQDHARLITDPTWPMQMRQYM